MVDNKGWSKYGVVMNKCGYTDLEMSGNHSLKGMAMYKI